MTVRIEDLDEYINQSIFNGEDCYHYPVILAKSSNNVTILRTMYNGVLYVDFFDKNTLLKTNKTPSKIPCRTVSELYTVRSELLNLGYKIDWDVYNHYLKVFNERFKTYSPYIPF